MNDLQIAEQVAKDALELYRRQRKEAERWRNVALGGVLIVGAFLVWMVIALFLS